MISGEKRNRGATWLKKWVIKPPQGVNISKMSRALMAVNYVQLAVLVIMLIRILSGEEDLPDGWLIFVCLSAAANNVILTRSGKNMEIYKQKVAEMGDLIRDQDDLNRQMRMQRHDFINHLQVISALVQMDEGTEAMEYMDQVYQDLQRVGTLLRTQSSAVNGLLAAKSVQGEKRGIRIGYDIATTLENLPLEDWEFCRVLSNLIDNAMDAAETAEDAAVELRLWEDIRGLHFSVKNSGPPIPEDMLERIFQPGVTTKGDRGTGMGLHIVDSILSEAGGDIQVESTEEATIFTGWLPPVPQNLKIDI